MPLYDYECVSCGHVFELRQSFDADPQGICPHCAGLSKRKFHAVPIIYKGSGFYTTDYKRTSFSDTSKEKEEDGSKKSSKTAKASADSSDDSKGTTKASTSSSEDKSTATKEA